MEKSNYGKVPKGVIATVAYEHHVSEKTISIISHRGQRRSKIERLLQIYEAGVCKIAAKKADSEAIQSSVKQSPSSKRSTIRMLASATEFPKSTPYGALKRGDIVLRTNSLTLLVADQHKSDRMIFALSFTKRLHNENKLIFENMRNLVHGNEKWYYLRKETQRIYLWPGRSHALMEHQKQTINSEGYVPVRGCTPSV